MRISRKVFIAAVFAFVAAGFAPIAAQSLPGDLAIGPSTGSQDRPAIARGDNQYLAVWEDGRAELVNTTIGQSDRDIYAARLDASGNVIDVTGIMVNQAAGQQTRPRVAWNGSNWLVVWLTEVPTQFYWTTGIVAARVSPAGVLLDPTPIPLVTFASSGANSELWGVASDGSNWAVVWKDFTSDWILQGRRIGPSGALLESGPVNIIFPGFTQPYSGDMVFAGNQYLMVWNRWNGTGDDVFGLRVSPSLLPVGPIFAVTTDAQYDLWPKVATDGAGFFVVWERYSNNWGGQVIGARVTAQGAVLDPLGISFPNSASFVTERYPDVAWDGANWHVAWSHYDVYPSQIRSAVISPSGVVSPSGAVISPGPAPQAYPSIAEVISGGALVVWQDFRGGGPLPRDIYGTLIGPNGQPGPGFAVSLAAPAQTKPRIAVGGFGYMIAYRSQVSGQRRIVAQRLDPFGGSPDPAPIEVGAPTTTNDNPAIAWNGALYLVVWDDGSQILGRRLTGDGIVVDPTPFTIMPGITPRVAAVGGDFLVVGTHTPTNPHFRFPFAVRVTGNGAVLGPPTSLGYSFALKPDVVAFGPRWLVTWERHPSHDDIYANIFASFVETNGTAGGEFGVNISTSAFNVDVSVSASPTAAIVAWQMGNDSAANIQGRRILLDGTLPDSFGIPISTASNGQSLPSIAFDGFDHRSVWQDRRNVAILLLDKRNDVYRTRVTGSAVVLDPAGVGIGTGPTNDMQPVVAGGAGSAVVVFATLAAPPPFGSYRLQVVVDSPPPCPGSVQSYGAACPGSGGFLPAITLGPCPTPNTTVTLSISGGLGGAPALIALGPGQGSIPIGNGCTLWVDPISDLLPVTLGGSGAGNGILEIDALVPFGLSGAIALQAGILDPGAAQSLAATNALLLMIQ